MLDKSIYEGFEPWEKNVQGWHGTDPVFEELIKDIKPKRIIEVGTWYGQSALNMASIVKSLNMETEIICVDTWLGAVEFIDKASGTQWDLFRKHGYPQAYYQFLSNVVHEGFEDIIIPFPQTSSIAARYFDSLDIGAELVYIDGSHEFEDVTLDIFNYKKLVSDGVIFGDDYSKSWPGVMDAVNNYVDEMGMKDRLTIKGEFWIIDLR